MTKDEALDLALRSLKELVPDESDYAPAIQGQRKRQEKAITAIKQARSAPYVASPRVQSAERGEPVALTDDEIWKFWWNKPEVPEGEDDSMEAQFVSACREAIKTVAQRQSARSAWIGLTDEEVFETHKQVDSMQYLTFGKAIEAKLREKNGWYRQHVTDGSPCWCEPEISYTNPETGASVIVHKEPQ